MSALEVSNLSINHGAIVAVRKLSFTVEKGQLAAIIGSNGAGKTTLLRALSGLIPASEGTATWKGKSLLGQKPENLVRSGVAHVSEGKSVIPELNVKENLALGGIW
jgi:branched-chain amino acid transport system ATP-binding protein